MDSPDAQRRREECERKARRGEMDPRLEFTFQLLMDGTGLPRHQIMDHIFEGNMVRSYAEKVIGTYFKLATTS
jgi:dynein heavy chain